MSGSNSTAAATSASGAANERRASGFGALNAMLTLKEQLREIYRRITERKDKSGRQLCEIFMELPSKKDYPDYYEIIKTPIALKGIQKKIQEGKYTSVEEMGVDIQRLVDNACAYNETQSQVYKDAKEIARLFRKLAAVCTGTLPATEAASTAVTVTVAVATPSSNGDKKKTPGSFTFSGPKDFLKVYNSLLAIKKSGYRLCELFEMLPDAKEYPQYYQIIKNPIALDTMKKRIDSKTYKTVEDFEKDMLLMVSNAKTFNEPGSAVHQDAIEILEHFYRLIGRTLDESKLKESLAEFTHEKVKYAIGDYVYLFDTKNPNVPNIAQIHDIWKLPSGQGFFQGQWFLRPEQTVHPISRRFYRQEVFRSDQFAEHLTSAVLGKCLVLFIKDYLRGRPSGGFIDEKDVYLCESRYQEHAKRIEKIKLWKTGLPIAVQNAEPELKPLEAPITLERVLSPFAKAEDLNKMEIDDQDAEEETPVGEDGPESQDKRKKSKDVKLRPSAETGSEFRSVTAKATLPSPAPMPPPSAARVPVTAGLVKPVQPSKPAPEVLPLETVKQFDHKGSRINWYGGMPLNIYRTKRAFESPAYASMKKKREISRKKTVDTRVELAPSASTNLSDPHVVQKCSQLLGEYAQLLEKNAIHMLQQ